MDTNSKPKNLQEKFDSLPDVIKNAVTSVDFANNLQKIGQKNGLHIDELDALLEEVGLVMIGETKASDFPPKLGKRLNLDEGKLSPLVQKIDEEIFKPIRSALMSLTKNDQTQKKEEVIIAKKEEETKPQQNTSPIISPVGSPEADYNMSRDAILSEIENPRPPEVKIDYVPRRDVETNDPEKYLKNRVTEKGYVSKPSTGEGKPSLAAEAVLVAEQKAAEKVSEEGLKKIVITKMPTSGEKPEPVIKDIKIITKLDLPSSASAEPKPPVETPSAVTSAQIPITPKVPTLTKTASALGFQIPTSPTSKLTTISQTPTTKVTLNDSGNNSPSQKVSDPYREQI